MTDLNGHTRWRFEFPRPVGWVATVVALIILVYLGAFVLDGQRLASTALNSFRAEAATRDTLLLQAAARVAATTEREHRMHAYLECVLNTRACIPVMEGLLWSRLADADRLDLERLGLRAVNRLTEGTRVPRFPQRPESP